jgi:catechol 2,3-dioxygenase-like lactoylglutathione lyase family enzyme
MLGRIDHVGYLVRDLEASLNDVSERLGLEVVRRFERPQFELVGVYLGADGGNVELFTFTDPALTESRLAGRELLLDHVAHEVQDIAAVASSLRAGGTSFTGPDQRGELTRAVDLGGVLHLWTMPETCGGLSLQLMQRP